MENVVTIAQPLVKLVEIHWEKFPGIKSAYEKVRKVVKQYARHRSVSLSNLPVAYVMSDKGGLHPELEKFIDRLERPQRRTPARHKEYKEEARARLRSIVAILLNGGDSQGEEPVTAPHSRVPDFMLPVLDAMPRVGGKRVKGKDESAKLVRRQLPLSEVGRLLLPLLLKIAKKYKLEKYEPIFLDHYREVWQLIRETYPESMWKHLRSRVGRIRRNLGLGPGKMKRERMNLEEFPPRLKNQCETYMTNAAVGLEHASPELAELAREYEVNVGRASKTSIKNNIMVIGTALSRMPSLAGKDIDVEDLLCLTKVARIVRGKARDSFVNPHIEELRARERKSVNRRKRAGLDSAVFERCLRAFKAVAAYNGIFEYHELFNRAYRVRVDKETTEAVKQDKKEAFPLKWVDGEIARLGVEFRRIIQEGSFKFGSLKEDGTKRTWHEVRKTMRLCLFYVSLVTLRYMGYRQQCLRVCVLGVHIRFDGKSIHFSWKADEVKNKKALTGTLTKGQDDRLYKVLIDTLRDYYKYIYPYLVETSGEILKGSFFVHQTSDGSFIPFDPENAVTFSNFFTEAGRDFLIFDGRLAAGSRSLNPHFFRGLTCDWLKEEGASDEAIADYVGNTVAVTKTKYLKKNTKQDMRRAINEADGAHAAKQRSHEESDLVKELKAGLKGKDHTIETLTKDLAHANDRIEKQAKDYERRIARLEADLADERKKRDRNHTQLMRALARLN